MNKGTARAGIVVVVLLVVAALVGAGTLLLRRGGNQGVEIIISTPTPDKSTLVYVEGAVANPGPYPLKEGDSLEDVLRAAGGATANADLSKLKIVVPQIGESPTKPQSQKININTADVKLLDGLPGIGPKRAQDIVDYRTKNGLFHTIRDITKIKGIGPATYEKLRDLITVAD